MWHNRAFKTFRTASVWCKVWQGVWRMYNNRYNTRTNGNWVEVTKK